MHHIKFLSLVQEMQDVKLRQLKEGETFYFNCPLVQIAVVTPQRVSSDS